jgi:hypothetical protein
METTSSTGTGTITLGGAVAGYQSFSAIGNGNTTYYTIAGGTEWEVGIGTYTASGTTLSRDTVLESSNGGSLVNFSAGTKNVFVTYPAEESVDQDTAQTLSNKTLASPVITNFAEFPDGTASAPSITNTGDTNTGIFFPAADTIAFTEGGVESMRIDANGNVGIGTSSPTSPLVLYRNSATSVSINVGNSINSWLSGIDSSGNFANYTNNTYNYIISTSGTERMRITANGGVAFGGASNFGTSGQVLQSNGDAAPSWVDSGFASGTRLAFQQTSAPTGWTKDTTAAINDAILRLVTGSVSSGGSTAFSTFNGQTATGAFTLTTNEIPSHNHTVTTSSSGTFGSAGVAGRNTGGPAQNTSSTGGGGSHSHSMTTNIKYYDFIIASKN